MGIARVVHTPFKPAVHSPMGPGGPTLPRAGLLFYAKAPGMVDTIGLLITPDQLPAELQSIFFDGETRRDDADIVTLMAASAYLNSNGLMFGSSIKNIWLLYGNQLSGRNKLKLYKWMFPYSDDGLEVLWGRAQGDVAGAIDWASGKSAVIEFIAPVSSDDSSLGTDLNICGPLYLRTGAVVLKDGTNTGICYGSWTAQQKLNIEISVSGKSMKLRFL